MMGGVTTLVTGGAGFIGSHVVEALLRRGDRVVCLDNFDTFYEPTIKRENVAAVRSDARFVLIEGDIRDRALVDRVYAEYGITRVFHGAARAGVRPSVSDPLLYEDVNVRGTLHLLEGARASRLSTFVFASSSSVYGGVAEVPFHEGMAVNHPISPYAATKLACEQLCYTYHHLHGIPITCLRFFTVYGPRQRPEMAIHRFASCIDQGKPITVYGDGSARRDFIYVDDILQGVLAALDRPFPFEIFNLGESATIELRNLIALLEAALGKRADIRFAPPEPGDMPVTYADVQKAHRMLQYNPNVPIQKGIERFVDWYRRRAVAA